MYTANINSKTFKNGKLTVEVTYSNGNENITDIHDVIHSQDSNWINDIINRKLNDLNSLSNINDSIVIGEFKENDLIESERDIYYKKATAYNRYMSIARNGFINHDRPIITELKEWLKSNFKDEYVNLF